jgi:hypothetical protein
MKIKFCSSPATLFLSAVLGGFASATLYCFLVYLHGSFTSGEFAWHPLEISVGGALSVVFFICTVLFLALYCLLRAQNLSKNALTCDAVAFLVSAVPLFLLGHVAKSLLSAAALAYGW